MESKPRPTARPRPTTSEQEKVCCQIREHLEDVSLVHSRSKILFVSRCGKTTYSPSTKSWRVEYEKTAQSERQFVAELHYQGESSKKTRKNSSSSFKRSRPLPPVELVESLFMSKELSVFVNQSLQTVKGTPQEEERIDKKVAQIDNVSFAKALSNERINFAVFLSMLHSKEDVDALLNRILGERDEPELWRKGQYRGWTVDTTNRSEDTKPKFDSRSDTKYRSGLASILETIGSLSQHNNKNTNNKRAATTTGDASNKTVSSPRGKRQRLEQPILGDSLANLKPPPEAATRSQLKRGPERRNENETTETSGPPTARPTALEESSESDHTTDDEGHGKRIREANNSSSKAATPSEAAASDGAIPECNTLVVTDVSCEGKQNAFLKEGSSPSLQSPESSPVDMESTQREQQEKLSGTAAVATEGSASLQGEASTKKVSIVTDDDRDNDEMPVLRQGSDTSKQTATSPRRSKRPQRSKVDPAVVDNHEKEDNGRMLLRQRKTKVTFAEEETEFFPLEQEKVEALRKPTRPRRASKGQEELSQLKQQAEEPSMRPTRSGRSRTLREPQGMEASSVPAARSEDEDSSKKNTRPRRQRTQIERYKDVRSEKIEEMKSSPVKDVEVSIRRAARSQSTRASVVEMPSLEKEDEPATQKAAGSRTARTRATPERRTRATAAKSQCCLVRIKVTGEDFVDPLGAVMASEGIPRSPRNPNHSFSSSEPANKYSLRVRRAQSYEEDDDDTILEDPVPTEAGIASDDSDDEDTPRYVVTPFIMNRKNILKVEKLVENYEESCYKRYGTCFSLKNGKDVSAKTSVDSLQKELEALDRKHPMEEEEDDEDIVAEQQLHNKTLRIMQGRRSQEKNMRQKEKEQAEHLANVLLSKNWTSKKKAPTIEEREWAEIVNRPILNSEARTVRGKRVGGRESCPCATTLTRNRDEQGPTCRLCVDTSKLFEGPSDPVPVKHMMPLFRRIDIDAPEFLERDGEGGVNLDIKDSEEAHKTDDSDEKKASRVSKRMKFDPRRRRETSKKLSELRHTMDFIEQYNFGLLPKITTGS